MMGSKMRLLDDPEAITGLLDALLSEIDLLRSGRTQPNDPQDHAAIISDDSLNFAGTQSWLLSESFFCGPFTTAARYSR